MKRALIILLIFSSLASYSQETVWVSRNDSLFMKRGNDSVYYSQYMFFDYCLKLKTDLSNAANLKTINGTSLFGGGNISILQNVDNTSDLNKPVSSATQTALNLKANITSLPVYARVTGSNATTTGQALADIAGLSIPLAANGVYEFQANLSVSTTAVTTGIQYGVQYSAAGAAVVGQIAGSSTSTATKTERVTTLNTASTAFLTTSAQSGGVTISGIITTGANAGNLTIKHLKVTSGTSTVFINSFLKVTRIQ